MNSDAKLYTISFWWSVSNFRTVLKLIDSCEPYIIRLFFCFSTKYFITPINRVHIARWVINRWSPLGKCGVRYYTESLTYYHFHTFDWRVSSWIIQKKKTRFLRRFAKTPFISPKCITHVHFDYISTILFDRSTRTFLPYASFASLTICCSLLFQSVEF